MDVNVGYEDLLEEVHFLLDDRDLSPKHKDNSRHPSNSIKAVIKKTLQKYHNVQPIPDAFSINGRSTSNPTEICNAFGEYYSHTASHLVWKIPPSGKSYTTYLRGQYRTTQILYPVKERQVARLISNLAEKYAMGVDDLRNVDIMALQSNITGPLTKLINKSFQTGIFPDSMKIAKIIPTHKSQDRDIIANYRPISVLPVISKIFDGIARERLYKYMMNSKLLFDSQYGYKDNHSTVNAITEFVANTLHGFAQKETTLAVFLDFIKFFDTFDHEILLGKLDHYEIRNVDLAWFKSFLSKRQQFVSYGGVDSRRHWAKYGGPQGSPLSSLLLLIYINDLPQVFSRARTIHYADDTILYMRGSDISKLFSDMNEDLNVLFEWSQANKLFLHLGKTNYVLFQPQSVQPSPNCEYKLKIGSTEIERKTNVNYLSFHLDELLNWSEHLKHLEAKLSKSVELMEEVKDDLHADNKVWLYYKIFNNPLSYGAMLWGPLINNDDLNRLFSLQKKIVKMIGTQVSIKCTFTKYGILRVRDVIEFDIVKFMYLFHHSHLPEPVMKAVAGTDNFTSYFKHYQNDTNSAQGYQANNQLLGNGFIYKGPMLWSDIPGALQNVSDIKTFIEQFRIRKLRTY